MRVEHGADCRIRIGQPQPLYQVTLAIVALRGHHRAVQAQQDHVERSFGADLVDDLVAKRFPQPLQGRAGRLRDRVQAFVDGVATGAAQLVDQAGDGAQFGRILGAAGAVVQAAFFEAAQAGGTGRKRIGFGDDTGSKDTHGGSCAGCG